MKKKNILIGVCGGIAAYKVCYLVRLFLKAGYSLKIMMTPAACQFIRPLVFKELSGHPVYTDMFSPAGEGIQHVSLSKWADIAVISPLSANTLSKTACGICDNLLTTVICALGREVPVLLVPAMNEGMWQNQIIQDNLARLKEIKNYKIMMPEKGNLACRRQGTGRMPEPEKICREAESLIN